MDEQKPFRVFEMTDDDNIDQAAAKHKLDKETFRVLKAFQDEFLMVSDISNDYIDHLKQHEHALKRMRWVFLSLGLARPGKGAFFAWRPRNSLREIIAERAGGPPDFSVKMDKWNEAIIKSCLEVAKVADFILNMLCALGLEGSFDDGSIPTKRMRQILVSATVKQGPRRVLNIRGSSVRAAKYLSLGCAASKVGDWGDLTRTSVANISR